MNQNTASTVNENTVTIPSSVRDEIIAHSRSGKPEEICGIIRGRGMVADMVVRGQNVAKDKINNYDVDPQTLLLQFEFEESGDAMLGIYHSHPVSPAYPSATDAWNAHYPDSIYFICSLQNEHKPVLRAFRLLTHFTDYDAESVGQAVDFYETRPGLFAYYVAKDQQSPAAVHTVTASIPLPVYLVYFTGGSEIETRIVHIEEVDIVIE